MAHPEGGEGTDCDRQGVFRGAHGEVWQIKGRPVRLLAPASGNGQDGRDGRSPGQGDEVCPSTSVVVSWLIGVKGKEIIQGGLLALTADSCTDQTWTCNEQ